MQDNYIDIKNEVQVLIFQLDNEELGLNISCVREVLKPQEIHHLPKAPEFIMGVINLRGFIIAIVDLRKKFNMPPKEENSDVRIIVCKINKFVMGIMVDSVSEVMGFLKKSVQAVPEVVSVGIDNDYIEGIIRFEDRVITLLNLENLLTKEDLADLVKIRR